MSITYLRSLSNSFSAIASVRPAMPAPLEDDSENAGGKGEFNLHNGNTCSLLFRHCRWDALKGAGRSSGDLLLGWDGFLIGNSNAPLFIDQNNAAQFELPADGCQGYLDNRRLNTHLGPNGTLMLTSLALKFTVWGNFSYFPPRYGQCGQPITAKVDLSQKAPKKPTIE